MCSIDSITTVDPVCNGDCSGSVEIFAQGSGPLFYQWIGLPGASGPLVTGLCAGMYEVILTDSTGCVISDSVEIVEPPVTDFSLSIVNATCPGGCTGSITVIPSDSLPYAYQWPGYINTGTTLGNLCQGVYSVIVTNAQGCSVIASDTVGYDPPFDLTFSTTPSTCLTSCNGTAMVFADGIAPFTYQWNTGPIQSTQQAVSLCAGPLTVSVTDSTGCVVSESVSITVEAPPVISFNTISPDCFGGCNGSAEIINSGTGNYLYEWNTFPVQNTTTAVGLCQGNYFIQITDISNGCLFIDSVLVDDPLPSTLSFTTSSSYCNNICTGSATVFSTAPAPLTYMWQTGSVSQTADSLCPGIFQVTVTDSLGCSSESSVLVEVQELLFNVTNSNCNNSCDGSAEVVLPPASQWQVAWDVIPVQNTPLITNLCQGNYVATLTDTTGCTVTGTVTITVLQPIMATFASEPVSCEGFCDGIITVVITGNSPFSITWLTLPGQNMDSVSQLCTGMYPVIISDSSGCSIVDSVLVDNPEVPQFTYTTIPNTCYNFCDASAEITMITPGTFTYEWQTNPFQYGATATGLCPLFTTIKITTAGGCTYLDSVLVIGTSPIYLSVNTVDPSCYGNCDGFADCQVFGGTPGYEYEWSNGFLSQQALNLCENVYTVTVTDLNGCSDTISTYIDAPDEITVAFTITDATCSSCGDGVVEATVSGGVPNYNYYWTPGGIGGAILDSLVPGIYNLCIADGNLCIQCFDAEVSFTIGVSDKDTPISNVLVFPNPFISTSTIRITGETEFTSGKTNFEVTDVYGRRINSVNITSVEKKSAYTDMHISNKGTATGIYLFRISGNDNFTYSGRFVIED